MASKLNRQWDCKFLPMKSQTAVRLMFDDDFFFGNYLAIKQNSIHFENVKSLAHSRIVIMWIKNYQAITLI